MNILKKAFFSILLLTNTAKANPFYYWNYIKNNSLWQYFNYEAVDQIEMDRLKEETQHNEDTKNLETNLLRLKEEEKILQETMRLEAAKIIQKKYRAHNFNKKLDNAIQQKMFKQLEADKARLASNKVQQKKLTSKKHRIYSFFKKLFSMFSCCYSLPEEDKEPQQATNLQPIPTQTPTIIRRTTPKPESNLSPKSPNAPNVESILPKPESQPMEMRNEDMISKAFEIIETRISSANSFEDKDFLSDLQKVYKAAAEITLKTNTPQVQMFFEKLSNLFVMAENTQKEACAASYVWAKTLIIIKNIRRILSEKSKILTSLDEAIMEMDNAKLNKEANTLRNYKTFFNPSLAEINNYAKDPIYALNKFKSIFTITSE